MPFQDFTTDNSLSFLLLLKEAKALPDWMENIPDTGEIEHLPSVAFADTHRRLMPIHNKEAAFLSAVSSCVYGYPSEGSWEDRLKAACCSYGIEDLVKQAHAVLSPESYHEKEATETEKRAYALELEVEPGKGPSNFYPINNRDEVEDSALKMAAHFNEQRLPGSWFVEAAEKIVKAASQFGVKENLIPHAVRRLAEDRLPSPSYLEEQIERRTKQASLDAEAVNIYKQAALGALDSDFSALDAAHVWELADRKLGIRYTDTVRPPVDAFRSGMTARSFEKIAGSVVMISDVQVPFAQLATLPDRLVATVLPRKTAAAVLAAKNEPDGIKAARHMQTLDESEQLQVLTLLTESAA